MSDIFDDAYKHTMHHQPAEVNSNGKAPTDDSNSIKVVNTNDFSARDLKIFVDSIETIARLKKAKRQRHLLDSSMAIDTSDQDARGSSSCESGYIYDETYDGQNIATPNALKSFSSFSDESGIFLNHTEDESHNYEDIDFNAIRPRSKVITYPKCKSQKSRLIALIVTKQYVQPVAPIADVLSSTTYGDDLEVNQTYDRVMDDAIQQQFINNTNRVQWKYRTLDNRPHFNSPEAKFVDKALSLMNLSI